MNLRVRPWANVFAHNIYLHVPHHVDMRIPFYRLPEAAAALRSHYGDGIQDRRLLLREYLDATRRCKLYDFEREEWSGYAEERGAVAPAPST
jgi:omega-6 fatty acid desaturase (delta-12 desaturase)